jgi:hypothetical protein
VAAQMKIDKAEVVAVRIELGVDRATLTQRRYENWRRLLMEGWSLEAVSDVYGVKPNSVKLGLWNNGRFSLMEARKKSLRSQQALLKDEKDWFGW